MLLSIALMTAFRFLKEKFSALPASQKGILILFVFVLLSFSAWAGYTFGFNGSKTQDKAISPTGEVIKEPVEELVNFPNPITGVLFKKSDVQSWVNNLVIGVIIENSTDARPQSGLSQADVVYEALAEGGITRFLAVFLQNDTTVGPVRSNRPYFIDWLSEYDAAYAHVGGSPEGQARIKAYGIKDLDQFFVGSPTYERVSSRAAPHNVYTTISKLREAATKRNYHKEAEITSWKFKDSEAPLEQRPASFSLNIGYLGSPGYKVEWRYNRETNTYLRFNAGQAHIDALTNKQLEFKTIVLQAVNKSADPSGKGRLFMDTVGSGPAKIFFDGKVVDATWKKESRTARTKYFDASGAEVKFNRGPVWVNITPPESVNTY